MNNETQNRLAIFLDIACEVSFNNPNALKEICRKGADGKVESERAIKVKLKSSIATAK